MIEYKMEKRECAHQRCHKKFTVLETSPQMFCSRICEAEVDPNVRAKLKQPPPIFGTRAHGEVRKQSSESAKHKLKQSEKNTTRILSSREENNESDIQITVTRKEQKVSDTMNETKKSKMQDATVGEKKIQSAVEPIPKLTTREAESNISTQKKSGETSVTLPELSDASQSKWQRESLGSMNLLGESARKLNRLMESCVSNSDLLKEDEGDRRVDAYRIEQAVGCANALAKVVQTQVNLVKAMTPFLKEKQ